MIGQTGCDLANRARASYWIAKLIADRNDACEAGQYQKAREMWAGAHNGPSASRTARRTVALSRHPGAEPQLEREPAMRASDVDSRLPVQASNALDNIERCCTRLFERWCESRRVVPLAYLMHAWPMADPGAHRAKRLSGALRDLLRFHADTLDSGDRRLIRYALAAADMATLI
ncbi:hypothetical protein [Paraburkholderia tropica]|uniref:hypothetical protein n=1 Tax=Paraburkholderia TaxID=1822464 RepID=UPI002AB5ED99|nr:hypothetical protein [Paraburkholderia tropica]